MSTMLCGKSGKGRTMFMGGIVGTYFIHIHNMEMPEYISVPKQPSWAEMNRGRKSKRARRGQKF